MARAVDTADTTATRAPAPIIVKSPVVATPVPAPTAPKPTVSIIPATTKLPFGTNPVPASVVVKPVVNTAPTAIKVAQTVSTPFVNPPNVATMVPPLIDGRTEQEILHGSTTDTGPKTTTPKSTDMVSTIPTGDPIKWDSGGGGSGGSGSGAGTGSGSGGGGGSAIGSEGWIKEQTDELLDGTFSWDPATDEQYKMQAAAIENDVMQSMVGRGGLYSSVAQNNLQSRLHELSTTMQQQRYEQWQNERSNTMQLINWAQSQNDRAYSKWQANQQAGLDRQQSQWDGENASYESDTAMAQQYINEWKNTGRVSNAMAAFFKTSPGAKPYNATIVQRKQDELASRFASLSERAKAINYTAGKLAIATRANQNAANNPTETATSYTTDQVMNDNIRTLGTTAQTSAYLNQKNALIAQYISNPYQLVAEYKSWIEDMTGANKAKYLQEYGPALYSRALADLQKSLEGIRLV